MGHVYTYKYFEIDLVENIDNCEIFIGLCESQNFRSDALPQKTPSTVICDGSNGEVSVGTKTRKFDFQMKNFGDVGGILLYNDPKDPKSGVEVVPTCNGSFCDNKEEPNDLKSQPEDIESHATKDKLSKKDKRKNEEKEEIRRQKRRKYKLYISEDVKVYPFIACNGA